MSGLPPADRATLDRALLQGLAWVVGSRWGIQVLRWGTTLVVARLLTPGDYGLIGMAATFLGLAQLINEMGLTAAIVQHRIADEDVLAELAGLSVLVGILLTAVTLLLAGPIAAFYHETRLTPIMLLLSVLFTIRAVQVVPRARLQIGLKFPRLALINGAEAIAQAIAALILAMAGAGYWALPLAMLAGAIGSSGVAAVQRPQRLAWPRHLSRLRATLGLGGHVVASRLAWYTYSNVDFAIAGRLLGRAALGGYSIAWTLANIPVERISALVGRVTPALFSRVQDDVAAMRRYFLGLTEGLALVTFPIAFGLALVARELILVVLGAHWRDAINPLRVLSVYGAVRSVTTLLPTVLIARGRSADNARFAIIAACVLPPLIFLGARWGTVGVALAWVVGYPLAVVPFYLRSTLKLLEARLADFLATLRPALVATAAMASAVLAMQALAARYHLPDATSLATGVATGAATYGLVVWLLYRDRLLAFREVLRQSKAKAEAVPENG